MNIPTILCVDDERNVLLTLRSQLMRHFPEYAIEIAESADEALALVDELIAEGGSIPLVIADQIMPGMQGDELLIELHTRYPDMVKVMLTGQARAEDVGNVVNRGNLYRFIAKPWNEADLNLTVTEALRRYQQDQRLQQQQAALAQANQELESLNTALEDQVQDRTQQLQAALQFNQQIIETVQEGIIVWDCDLRYQLWNGFMETLSGVPATAVVGQYCLDLFPFLRENGIFDLIQRALAGESVCAADAYFHVPETGRTGWSYECFTPLRDEGGNITGVLGVVHDITDRKQAELEQHQLLKQLSDLKFALDQSAIVATTDARGRITVVNDRFCEVSQYSREELIGNTHQLINSGYHPRSFFRDLWRTISSGQVWKGEIQNQAKDGSEYWMDTVIVPFLDDRGVPFQYMAIRFEITERKQAELALRQSEAGLAEAQRIAQLGNWEFDLTTQTIVWSEGLFRIFGRDPAQAEPSYEEFQQLIHPDDRPILVAAVERAIADHVPYTVEHRIIHSNGELRHLLGKGEAVLDQDGRIIKLVGTSQDITTAKLAELALRQSEEQFRQLTDNIREVFYIYDLDPYQVRYISPAFETIWGISNQELERQPNLWMDCLHPDDCDRVIHATAQQQSGHQFEEEYRIVRPDGQIRWISARSSPIADPSGKFYRIVGVCADITARKQAELALRDSEEQNRAILSAIPDIMTVVNADGRYQRYSYNEAVGEAIPLNRNPIGLHITDVLPPVCVSQWLAGIQQVLRTGEPQAFEQQLQFDDRVHYEEVRIVPYQTDKVLCMIRDISDRKQAEAERNQLAAQLQQREAFLQSIYNNVEMGIYVIDVTADGDFLYIDNNLAANRMARLEPDFLKGKRLSEWAFAMSPESYQAVRSRYQQCVDTGEVIEFEDKTTFHGEDEWWLARVAPVKNEQGEVTRLIVTSFSITDRKQAELALQASEAQLRNAQRIAQLGNWEFELATQTVTWSEELFRLYGRDSSQWSPTYTEFQQQVHPDDWEQFEQVIQRAIDEGVSYAIEHRVIRPDGNLRYAVSKGEVAFDSHGQVIKLFGTTQDITTTKQAALALQESEARFRRLTENLPGVVYRYVRHPDGSDAFTYLSPRCREVLGVDVQTALQSSSVLWSTLHPDDVPVMQAAIADSIQHPDRPSSAEYRITTPTGKLKWIQSVVAPLVQMANGDLTWDGVMLDITERAQLEAERRLAEEALRDSQQFIHQIADSSPNVIYIYDLAQHRNVYVNREVYTFLGYTSEEIRDQVDQSLDRLMHPDDLERAGQHFAHLMTLPDGAIAEFEYRMQHKTGEWRWFSSRDTIFKRDADGQVTQILGNAQDITARKQAEIALSNSERRYASLATNSPVGIFQTDTMGECIYVNPMWCQLSGLTFAEASGPNWARALHPDDRDPIATTWYEATQQQTSFTLECRFQLPTGKVNWIYVQAAPLLDDAGNYTGYLGTITDISDRKQAEDALRASEQKYHQILDSITDMVIVKEPDSRIVWGNKAFRDYYGMSLSELQGMIDAPFSAPDDTLQYVRDDTFVFSTGQTLEIPEEAVTRYDGMVRTFSTIKTPIRDRDEQVIMLVAVCRDITVQKEIEAEVRRSQEQLAAIAANIPGGVFRFIYHADGSHSCPYVSEGYRGLLGIDPELFRTNPHVNLEMVHPDDRPIYESAAAAAITGQSTTFQEEVRYVLANGEIKWISTTAQLHREVNGDVIVDGIDIDISDRKRNETALQFQATILEQIHDSVVATDPAGNITHWNMGAEQMYGYRAEDAIGQNVAMLYAPEDLPILQQDIIAPLMDHGQHEVEVLNRHQSGKTIAVNLRLSLLKDTTGAVIGLLGCSYDITERKRLEAERKRLEFELRQREAFLDSIYNGVEMAISVIDVEPDGTFRFIDFNPACTKFTGIDMAVLRGKTLDDLAPYMASAALEGTRQQYQHCVATGESIQFEVAASAPNQEEWWLTCQAPLTDETGRVYRLIGTSIPITERKRAEAQLEAQNDLLARIAKGEPLNDILATLIQQVEQNLQGALCSVLLLDTEQRLHHGAAPSLPAAYIQAVDGVLIGEGIGSCGTAAFRNETVIVADIVTDPLWQDFKDIALGYGLRACWSVPIAAGNGQVLGTFGVYYPDVRSPQSYELDIITQIANVAGIAIERDQAEAKIRQSEEQLRLTLDFTGIGAWSWHPVTGEYHWTGKMVELLELPPGLDNMFQTWCDRIHPDDVEQVTDSIQQALTNRTTFMEEYRYYRLDGCLVWRWAAGQGIYTETGELERVLGVAQDITERKQAEVALRQSEAKNRAMLAAIPDLLLRVKRDGTCLDFIPPTVATDPGFLPIQSNIAEVLPAEILQHQMQRMDQALMTSELQVWEQQLDRFGTLCNEEVRLSHCQDDEFLIIVRDITARKQAELALQASEARFRQLAETVREGFFVFETASLTYSYVNPAYAAIMNGTGQTYQDLSGWLDQIHPDDRADVESAFQRELQGEIVDKEYRFLRTDGTIRWMRSQAFPVRDETGAVNRIVGTMEDISDRKQAEISLQRTNQLLSAISEAQTRFITEADPGILFDNLLEALLQLTNSEYGFIGEILYNPNGQAYVDESYMKMRGKPYLKTKAITDIAWNEETRHFYDIHAAQGMEFHNLKTLFGQVMVTGEPVISNSPGTDPRRGGLPDGHPPLNAFLGVPFYRGDHLVGMVGIANRPDGYNDGVIAELEPFLTTCSSTIEAYRNDTRRKQAEQALRQSEATKNAIIQAIPDLLIRMDWHGRYRELIRSQYLHVLLPDRPIEESTVYDVLPAEEAARRMHYTQRAVETNCLQMYDQTLVIDGQICYEEVRIAPLLDQEVLVIVRDITDRKRAELALAEIESQQRSILENVPSFIVKVDRDGRMLFANRLAEGFTRDTIIGQNLDTFTAPASREQQHAALTEVFATGQTVTIETDGTGDHGAPANYEVRIAPIVTDGHIDAAILVATDITDRKRSEAERQRAEEALRASEAQYRRIVETANEGIWIIDTDNRTSFVNPKMAEILGYSVDDMMGKPMFDFMDDTGVAMAAQNAARRRQGITEQHDFKFQHKNGADVWALLATNPILDDTGQYIGALGMVTDISDRKRTELALQRSEEQLRLALEFGRIAIWDWNVTTGKLVWNEIAYQILGYQPGAVAPTYDTWLQAVHPADREAANQEIERALLEKRDFAIEYRVVWADSTQRWLIDSGRGIYDADGNAVRAIGIMLDITDRKQAEIALQSLVEGTASVTGEDFFPVLAQQIATALNISHVMVSRYMGETFQSLAFYADHQIQNNFTCAIAHTPCERSLRDGYYYCPTNIQAEFPLNSNLTLFETDSYLGIALRNMLGEAIGVLCIFDRAPIANPQRAESLLRIFGARAAAEMERSQALEALQQLNAELEQRVQQRTEELARSEHDLRTIFNNVYDAILIHDMDGTILDVNDRTLELQTATREQLIGSGVADLSAPEAPLDRLPEVLQRLQAGESLQLEWKHRRFSDDSTFDVEVSLRQVTLGNRPVFIACVRDISDRKQAQEALQAERLRLQLALDAAQMGTWSCNPYTGVLNWSDRAQEIFGFVPGTFPGDRETFLSLVYPEDRERVIQAIAHTFETRTPYNIEYRIRRLDGDIRWLAVWGIISADLPVTEAQLIGVVADITDRKQAEAALRDSEERLRLALTAASQGLYDLNLQTGDAIVSPEYATMLGYDPVTFQETNPHWIERLHPDDREAAVAIYHAYVAGDISTYKLEFRQRMANGNWKWVLSVGKIVAWDEDGQPLRMLGTHTDIDDRKQAEAALHQAMTTNQALLNAIPDLILLISRDGVYREAITNRGMDLILTREEQLGKSLWEVLPADLAQQRMDAIEQAFQTGLPQIHEYAIEIHGEQRYEEARCVVCRDDEAMVLVRDITDRKRAEQDVQESRNMLKLVLDTIPQRVFWKDHQSRFLGCNSAFAADYQLPMADIVGKTDSELPWAEWAHLYNADDANVIHTGTPKLNYEEPSNNLQGEPIWIRSSKIPLTNSQGEVIGILGCYDDITDRKRAEQALRDSEERFRQLAETVDAVFWLTDLQPQILYVSPAFERVWGRTSEAVFHSREHFLATLHPDDVAMTESNMARRFEAEVDFEYRIIRPTGEIRWIRDRAFPIYDETGNVYRIAGVAEDITDRKRAELALRESEERFRTLFEATPNPIQGYDKNRCVIFWNRASEVLYGYSRAEAMGKPVESLIIPESMWAGVLPIVDDWIADRGDPLPDGELQLRNQAGEAVEVYSSHVMLTSLNGDREMYCIDVDLRDRKRAEAQLREQEQFLRSIYEGANQPIFVGDVLPDHTIRITGWNPVAARLIGRSSEEIAGKSVTEIFPPKEASEMLDRYTQCITTQQPATFEEYITFQGQSRWMLSTYNPLIDDSGRVYRVVGTVYDITDLKQAEAQLRESQQFAQSIADKTPAALYIYDLLDNCNLYSNRSIVEMLGYTTTEIQAMGANLMPRLLHPEDGEKVAQHQQAIATATDGIDLELEYRMCHANGEWRWFYSRDSVFKRDETGRVTQYIGAAQDITDRKRLEQELRQINIELEQRVAERTIDLQHAMEAAEMANRAKSTFLANMSHELRTPLNAILGFAQLMSRDRRLEAEKRQQLSIINRSGEHLLNLINDILEMSKIEAGRTTFHPTAFDLYALLDTLEEMFRLRAIEKGLHLRFERDPAVPQYIETDESKLRQVLINLIGNAVKFTRQGRVSLRVTVTNGDMKAWSRVRLEPTTQSTLPPIALLFLVEDTGPGIESTEIESLFEPFIQSQNRQIAQEGTGLGLPISRQFVRMMDGDLTVSSIPGQGSVFRFNIVVRPAAVTHLSARPLTQQVVRLAPNQPTYRILVVEDQPNNRQLLVQLLTAIGFEVWATTNGQEAVALWETWQPHLIWMDMRMPVMDGYEATHQIRAREHQLGIESPVVILALTASAFEEERARVLAVGCNDFVRKPFQETNLLEKIVEHLGVEYIYAEPEQTALLANQSSSEPFDAIAALQELPAPTLVQLYENTTQLDNEQLAILLHQVAPDHPTLAALLLEKLDNFDFQQILNLLEQAMPTPDASEPPQV